MWEINFDSSHADVMRPEAVKLRLAHSASSCAESSTTANSYGVAGVSSAVTPTLASTPERLSARGAQRLMQGIFNLGYGTSGFSDRSWMEDALCAQTDPDIFYPEKGGSTAPATSVCKNCAVRAQCLEYAVSNDIRHGIWGGTSDNDRKKMARERRMGHMVRGGSR